MVFMADFPGAHAAHRVLHAISLSNRDLQVLPTWKAPLWLIAKLALSCVLVMSPWSTLKAPQETTNVSHYGISY